MVMPKKIGVIGVGHMSGTMIEGWARLGDDMPRFYLSPRGAALDGRIGYTAGNGATARGTGVPGRCDYGARKWYAGRSFGG